MMNEDNHPCMAGHKLFAETVAEAISGKRISLAAVPPLADTLQDYHWIVSLSGSRLSVPSGMAHPYRA